MTIRFACRCGKKMKTSDDKIGKKILCSACGSPVVVPSDDTIAIEKVIAPAGASSTTAASDTASALLRGTPAPQAQKKNRKTLAFDDPAMAAEVAIDATASAKHIAKGFLLPIAGIAVACVLVSALAKWITGTGTKLPPLAEVSGSVYFDGEPLPGAVVTFRPQGDAQNIPKASASEARTDEKGRFRMRYTREHYGVPIGKCIVTISKMDTNGQEMTPLRYRDRTETREVEKSGNEFDFQLKSADQ